MRCLLLDLFGGSGHYLGSPQRGMAFPAKGLAEHVLQFLLRAPAPGLTKVEHSLSHTLTPPTPTPHTQERISAPAVFLNPIRRNIPGNMLGPGDA